MVCLFAIPEYDPSVVAQFNPVIAQPAYGLRVDAMLFVQYPCRQRLLGIAAQHRHSGLNDDRAVIEIGGDEMHRAAVDSYPVPQCARMGVEAAVGGQ